MNKLSDAISHFHPCPAAVALLDQYASWDKAWAASKRGDWMLWLFGRLNGHKGADVNFKLGLCAGECVRAALPHVAPDCSRSTRAIEAAAARASGGDAYAAAYVVSAACESYAGILRECADIVRNHYPLSPITKGESHAESH